MRKYIRILVLCALIAPVNTVMATAENSPQNQTPPALKLEATDMLNQIILKIGEPHIQINGQKQPIDAEGTTAFIENGSTYVPLRSIFEALGAEVEWKQATGSIIGKRKGTEIQLAIGSDILYRNGKSIRINAAPKLVKGKTMVPLRLIAESFGAEVQWESESRTITITEKEKYISIKGKKVALGDSQESVEKTFGKANRIDPSGYDFKWHIYNQDYSQFIMIGIKNGIVEAAYTNAKGFESSGMHYGQLPLEDIPDAITLYFDKHNQNKVHAILLQSENVSVSEENYHNPAFFKAQEMQNFDATNAFRVNYGLQPLKLDTIAADTARKHSQDMADQNYFSHTNLKGLSPWQRYANNQGKNKGSGENISAGRLFGIDAFDGWVNSEGHRSNMLGKNHKYLGVGYGYNPSSTYNYYLTQLFTN